MCTNQATLLYECKLNFHAEEDIVITSKRSCNKVA